MAGKVVNHKEMPKNESELYFINNANNLEKNVKVPVTNVAEQLEACTHIVETASFAEHFDLNRRFHTKMTLDKKISDALVV